MTDFGVATLFVIIIPALIGVYNGFKHWEAINDVTRIKTSVFVMFGLIFFATVFMVTGDTFIGSILVALCVGWGSYGIVSSHIICALPDEEEVTKEEDERLESFTDDLEGRIKALKEKNSK